MNNHVSLGQQASFLCCGFQAGYFGKKDIEHCAEREIARLDQPSLDVIELALLREKDEWEVIGMLQRLGADIPARVWTEWTIGFLGKLAHANPQSLPSHVAALVRLLYEDDYELTADEEAFIYWLDDAYDLARCGVSGHITDVSGEFLTFTTPHMKTVEEQEKRLSLHA